MIAINLDQCFSKWVMPTPHCLLVCWDGPRGCSRLFPKEWEAEGRLSNAAEGFTCIAAWPTQIPALWPLASVKFLLLTSCHSLRLHSYHWWLCTSQDSLCRVALLLLYHLSHGNLISQLYCPNSPSISFSSDREREKWLLSRPQDGPPLSPGPLVSSWLQHFQQQVELKVHRSPLGRARREPSSQVGMVPHKLPTKQSSSTPPGQGRV